MRVSAVLSMELYLIKLYVLWLYSFLLTNYLQPLGMLGVSFDNPKIMVIGDVLALSAPSHASISTRGAQALDGFVKKEQFVLGMCLVGCKKYTTKFCR